MAKFGMWFARRVILLLAVSLVLFCGVKEANATPLAERLADFPQWQNKPPVEAVQGDLIYPEWMAGTWEVTSTLVDLAAPLAPDVTTPGFENNRQFLHQPVRFQVRFAPNQGNAVVSDRSFNGLSIAKAYLEDSKASIVQAVKVDPQNPNRQITLLKGDRQLISTVTGRATETPAPNRFIATEVTQQFFRGTSQVYLNEVETTTAYQYLHSGIQADQVTAIYLSPQDPNYFKVLNRPVALYRYTLELIPVALQR
ncbi:MAG: hypothetical protein LRZ84_09945 [Desertifilum sp.]|nr:hypothetical protein [Desertifilum sp.]